MVLNDNMGGGLTAILTAGGDRAGQKWTITFSIGQPEWSRSVAGYGFDFIDNWLFLSVTPPFFGFLDANGSARVDLPAGSVPPGIQADFAFILQDGARPVRSDHADQLNPRVRLVRPARAFLPSAFHGWADRFAGPGLPMGLR